MAIVLTALLGVVTSGWACGLTREVSMPGGQHAMASMDDASALPGNPMKDCQGSGTSRSNVPAPCVALCAVTVTVAPAISPAIAVVIGEPHYPASPSLHSWLVQPEPYPPRA